MTCRTFLLVLRFLRDDGRAGSAIITGEDAEDEAEHIEGGQSGGQKADTPEDVVPGVAAARRLRQHGTENLVLAPEAGERRDAADGQRGDEECPEGDGQFLAQAAMARMSCWPLSAWITTPAARKSRALK